MGNESSKQEPQLQRQLTEEDTVPGLLPIEDLVSQTYDIENLVFANGSAEGFSYAGAVKVLEKLGLLLEVKRFAGVGTGALVASILALGLSSDELQEAFNKYLDNLLVDVQVEYDDLKKTFTESYGWNSGTKFFDWFSLLLESKSFDPDLTFLQLYEKTNKELCVIVTNVDKLTLEYFHPKTTPDLSIKRAVFTSMSIPGIFAPTKYGPGIPKCLYIDGSMMCRYPIRSFDGWLLSMDSEDSILKQVESPDQYPLYDNVSNLKNDRTLGFFCISKLQETHYETFVDRLTKEDADTTIPDTTLAEKYKTASQERASATETFTLVRKTCTALLSLASDLEDEQGSIPIESFVDQVFDDKSLRKDCSLIPEFGDDKFDLKGFLSSIGDSDTNVSHSSLKRFVQRKILFLLDEYSGYHKNRVSDLRSYLATIFDTVHYLNLPESDYDRSVGILCGHVGTNDIYFEDDDQKYLYRQGWNATVSYFRQMNKQCDECPSNE